MNEGISEPSVGNPHGGARNHPFEGKGLFGLSSLGFGLFSLCPFVTCKNGVGKESVNSPLSGLTVLALPEPEGVSLRNRVSL